MIRVFKGKDLGVLLDAKLVFRHHIDRVLGRCRSTLGLLKRFAKDLGDLEVTKALYHALVRLIANMLC